VSAFTGTLATRIIQLKPYDPESKGIVERRNQFFETSFMPGRTFTSPTDNAQFTAWLQIANRKVVRTIKGAPVDLIERDRDADLDRVRVRAGGRIVADHARVWARGSTITDPAHVESAKRLREQFQQPRPVHPVDDLTRDLADYERAFGLTGEVA
jgi:hypothetical protein